MVWCPQFATPCQSYMTLEQSSSLVLVVRPEKVYVDLNESF